jgi:hypothetical protein
MDFIVKYRNHGYGNGGGDRRREELPLNEGVGKWKPKLFGWGF